jgi:hypothetical protein
MIEKGWKVVGHALRHTLQARATACHRMYCTGTLDSMSCSGIRLGHQRLKQQVNNASYILVYHPAQARDYST